MFKNLFTKKNINGPILGVALYISCLYPGDFYNWLPLLILWFIFGDNVKLQPNDMLLLTFLAGVFILTTVGQLTLTTSNFNLSLHPFFYFLLLPCVMIGRWISKEAIFWLLFCICCEAVICGFQYATNTPYFFSRQASVLFDTETPWGSTDLFYFKRVFGLSPNSSTAAQKFFLGILLLLTYFHKQKRLLCIFFCCLICGLFTTFNRTAILSCLIFGVSKSLIQLFSGSLSKLLKGITVIAVITAAVLFFWPEIEYQLRRGSERSFSEEWGRQELLERGMNQIYENPLFGNFSQQFTVEISGIQSNLHNTWLQLFADHGVVALFLILYSVSFVNAKNFPIFISCFFYSVFQFALFGKFSLINIIFFHLMQKSKTI